MAKKQAKYRVAGVTELRGILEMQKYKCALTGVELTPQNCSFDHRLPLSKGGTSLRENLQAVCKPVNISKSNFTMSEYLQLCFDVLNHAGHAFGYKALKREPK